MVTTSSDIEKIFTASGATFACPVEEFKKKLVGIKAFILDWDGVFNAGIKGNDHGSPFSEVDSMGLNMLRFSFFLKNGYIPAIFIVTGENNQPALKLSKREHFNGVYLKVPDKVRALTHISDQFGFKGEEIGFVFDDILDLSVADKVSLRYYIKRAANPLLTGYIERNNLVDYYTANKGENNAVREVAEVNIGLLGNYDEVVKHRIEFSKQYKDYLAQRNSQQTQYYTLENDRITEYRFA